MKFIKLKVVHCTFIHLSIEMYNAEMKVICTLHSLNCVNYVSTMQNCIADYFTQLHFVYTVTYFIIGLCTPFRS